MKMRNFGRSQQMWLLVVALLGLFSILLGLIPGMTFALWWKVVLVGAFSSGFSIASFQVWLGRVLTRRESSIQLIDRITAGDLSLSGDDILRATNSKRLAAAMRALVNNLERTIRRFGQLAGRYTVPAEFDAPLPADVQALFEVG